MAVLVPLVCVCLLSFAKGQNLELSSDEFPEDFLFGTATSAYQTEGAWNVNGKGENIWDYLTHNYPDRIADGSNADISCDTYHHVEDDVAILRDLGVDYYRFSISWSRLLPNGFSHEINDDAVRYYNFLIDALLNNGITPMVTLYHWDLPQILQKLGGWSNVNIVDYFTDYANVAFENFGDRVRYWITFNEPDLFCEAYGALEFAPIEVKADGIGDYLCSHHVLLAHASAYHLYNESFKTTQRGSLGIALSSRWYLPNTTSVEDIEAANRFLQFKVGRFAHPIYIGDYPEIVKNLVAIRSQEEGFPYSRLPEFTPTEIDYIRGSSDFFGLNFYTAELAANGPQNVPTAPSYNRDHNVVIEPENPWQATPISWLKVTPWGFQEVLIWLKNEYSNPLIFVTENGVPDAENYNDEERIYYLRTHLSALLSAIAEGVNVKMYTFWSLFDNFEWDLGYTVKFGLYHVNMSDPSRTREPKASAQIYKQIINNRRLIINDISVDNGGPESILCNICLIVGGLLIVFRNYLN
ncbi:myrosinase 1-like [Agrilus planipennis]|uniref:Myrosinase 1-like n=1 Tax=Agrilus planipennis TaxID=224129 RepID=A0A1W4W823_AGRPL|nr:myrosinase 1-like [Agrilus planipennis]